MIVTVSSVSACNVSLSVKATVVPLVPLTVISRLSSAPANAPLFKSRVVVPTADLRSNETMFSTSAKVTLSLDVVFISFVRPEVPARLIVRRSVPAVTSVFVT